MKKTKHFSFTYPLKHKIVRDLKIVTEHIGNIECECVGYFDPSTNPLNVFQRYQVDIDFAKWNGEDIKPVLVVLGGMEEIEEAALLEFARLMEPSPKLNLGKAFEVFKKAI